MPASDARRPGAGRLCLMLACNDHRNGHFAGRFDSAELSGDDTLLRLRGPETRLACPRGRKAIRVGRVLVPYGRYWQWYGNWCWDGFGVTPEAAEKALAYLHARGFDCEEGEAELFNKWKAGPVTAADLIEAEARYV